MVEYALILVLVAIAAITALGLLSGQISAAFGRISTALGGGGGGGGGGL
jgi:Flp pilus assembly pilin Flp